LPPLIKCEIEARIGERVVRSNTQSGGFSPGMAARLVTAGGREIFVKAVSEQANPDTPQMHRREAEVVAALPPEAPVPRLLWSFDEAGWVVLGFEAVDGRTPTQPWRADEVRMVVAALHRLHQALTPSPIASDTASNLLASHIKGWGELRQAGGLDPWTHRNIDRLVELEARAPAAAAGETLLHLDVRADNLLIAADQVYFVDWPWALIGAPLVDWVGFAPSLAMQGGPQPDDLLAMAGLTVAPDAIDAVIAALAGYFLAYARRPPPPGIPTVRAFQAAQGEIALRWLRKRTGWDES
jgi:aminoglycoside phosphotransferase (APT) family kinase protein